MENAGPARQSVTRSGRSSTAHASGSVPPTAVVYGAGRTLLTPADTGGYVRWERLFEDLEGQLEAASAAELAGEVAERTRIELGRLRFADRLMAGVGEPVALDLQGGALVEGRLERAADQ